MNEAAFWKTVRPLLAGLDPMRVENPVLPGTPDVNCTLGWIELKYVGVEQIPKRPETPFRIDHFTAQQRVWLYKRAKAQGACWLLLRLGDERMLFEGDIAAEHLGKETLETTRRFAYGRWESCPTKFEFQDIIRRSKLMRGWH
ncbi:MAG: hypothetical protein IT435_02480 [Phycisphaerales bacterium]|nr:hypothetical protein [Phycisphaerales bacterium]